jgi:hypothetical protein
MTLTSESKPFLSLEQGCVQASIHGNEVQFVLDNHMLIEELAIEYLKSVVADRENLLIAEKSSTSQYHSPVVITAKVIGEFRKGDGDPKFAKKLIQGKL